MKEILLLYATFALAAGPAPQGPAHRKPMPAKPPAQEESSPANNWLAIPLAALGGFGLGHMAQGRYEGYPITFTVADAAGFGLILASMGDCSPSCHDSKNRLHRIGLGLLIASRITQVVDVSLFTLNNGMRLIASPGQEGGQLTATLDF